MTNCCLKNQIACPRSFTLITVVNCTNYNLAPPLPKKKKKIDDMFTYYSTLNWMPLLLLRSSSIVSMIAWRLLTFLAGINTTWEWSISSLFIATLQKNTSKQHITKILFRAIKRWCILHQTVFKIKAFNINLPFTTKMLICLPKILY